MPRERYRRNIHNEDRQTYLFEDTPSKQQIIDGMYIKVGALRAQAERASKAGKAKEAEQLFDLESKTIGRLRRIMQSKSRR